MQMKLQITPLLSFVFSTSHPFSPFCLSRLSDKRCLLAINPGGALTGVPIKRSIFSPFGEFVRGLKEVR